MASHNHLYMINLLLYLILALPIPALAHAVLVKSKPAKDSIITKYPQRVDIWFNEKIASEYKALAIINSKGKRVDNKDIKHEILDLSHIYITTPKLPPDTYTVRYRVMSADTHLVTGKFIFTISTPN